MRASTQFVTEDNLRPDEARRILGVSSAARADEVKKAWRELVRRHHADVGGSHDTIAQVNRAYDVLRTDKLKPSVIDAHDDDDEDDFWGTSQSSKSSGGPPYTPKTEPFKTPGFFDMLMSGRDRVSAERDRKNVTHLLIQAHQQFKVNDRRGKPEQTPAYVTTTGTIMGYDPLTDDVLRYIGKRVVSMGPYAFQYVDTHEVDLGLSSGKKMVGGPAVRVIWRRDDPRYR